MIKKVLFIILSVIVVLVVVLKDVFDVIRMKHRVTAALSQCHDVAQLGLGIGQVALLKALADQ